MLVITIFSLLFQDKVYKCPWLIARMSNLASEFFFFFFQFTGVLDFSVITHPYPYESVTARAQMSYSTKAKASVDTERKKTRGGYKSKPFMHLIPYYFLY